MGSVATYADASFTSAASSVTFGTAVDGDGDLNADGDVVVGAPGWDSPASNAGAAFVYLGGTNAAFTTSTADAQLTGETAGSAAGTQVAIPGDTNNDGCDDFIVGGLGRSKLWVFGGP